MDISNIHSTNLKIKPHNLNIIAQRMLLPCLLAASTLLSPHKRNPWPRREIPRAPGCPTSAVALPVPVACVDCAVAIDALNYRNMTERARALHSWLQNNN